MSVVSALRPATNYKFAGLTPDLRQPMPRDKLNGHSKKEKQIGPHKNPSPTKLTIRRLTPEKQLPLN